MAKVNAIFLIFPIDKAAGQRKRRYTDPSLSLDRLVKGGAAKGGEEFLGNYGDTILNSATPSPRIT